MSLYRLKRLADTAPPDLRAWLLAAVERYEEGGEDMGSALAINGTRGLIRRNEVLLDAGGIIDPHEELRPYRRAGQLAEAIKQFKSKGSTGNDDLDCLIAESLDFKQTRTSQRGLYELME